MEWVCAADKATIYICEEGILCCNSQFSEQHNDLIINWRFDCGGHMGPHRGIHSLTSDYESFNHALSIAMLQSTWATAEWAIKLIHNVKRQFNRK